MSIQEERELSQRLEDLLGGVDPRPAPFDSVLRHGRGIKRRRRAAVAGGLAVVAAAAIFGPTVLRSELATPPPAAHIRHYAVSVSPPAKGAKPDVIATGSINGWRWQAKLEGSGKNVAVDLGSQFSILTLSPPSFAQGSLASFESGTENMVRDSYIAAAAPGVRYFTVTLSNGQVLTLRPRAWAGHRYVAMVLPTALQVTRSVAYGARGEVGYAVPFNYGGNAVFQTWLRPGQTGSAEATTRIGAGRSGHSRWSATAYVGPWGLCAEVDEPGTDGAGGFCQNVGDRSRFGLVSGQFGSGPGGVEIGLARRDVAYLLVTRSDGSVVRVPVAYVAGYPYGLMAVIRPGHPAFTSWVAYDGSGNRLGSGKGDPVGFK